MLLLFNKKENKMPVDPITGQLGPYSNEYLDAAKNVANGTTAPYAPGYLTSVGLGGAEFTQPQAVDHTYDAWGGRAGYDSAVGQIDSGLGNIRTSGSNAINDSFNTNRQSLLNAARGYSDSQTSINNSRANNELSRLNSIQDVLGYVRTGLRQGSARLAQGNAMDSSATGALQRAYQQIGSQKARGVNNAAGLKSIEIDQSQNALNTQIQRSKEDLLTTRNNEASRIGTSVEQSLRQLDQQAVGLSLPGRIAIDQEKQNIVNQALAKLGELDSFFQGELNKLHANNQGETAAQAEQLRLAGTVTSNPFNLSLDSQQQVSGAPIDQLPLFTRRSKITG